MMFAAKPDNVVKAMMNQHFALITGLEPFKPKGKSKDASPIPIQQFTFLNAMVFIQAFTEAKKRGILNAVEAKQGQELLDIINNMEA